MKKRINVPGLEGEFETMREVAKALGLEFVQFEYRWYKLGLRTKEQFDNYQYPKPKYKSDVSGLNKILNAWRYHGHY